MKIGILTLANAVNYGAILQALAMQEYYRRLGHKVVLVDKWCAPRNEWLWGPLANLSVGRLVRLVYWCVGGSGDLADLTRRVRTAWLLRKWFDWTSYHFYDWKDAPESLGLDLISVGSDQVWNPTITNIADYLFVNVAYDVKAIAYAASIGRHDLPPDLKDVYAKGFKRFAAISVREAEAARQVSEMGGVATHVVDPTLLVNESFWREIAGSVTEKRQKLVCYTIGGNLERLFECLNEFSVRNKCDVDVFVGYAVFRRPTKNPLSVLGTLAFRARLIRSGVRFRLAAGPREFVRAFSEAKWVVANSFHAVMFSTIFRKNFRIFRFADSVNQQKSARIDEAIREFTLGADLIHDSIAAALDSLVNEPSVVYNEEAIAQRREESRRWLEAALRDKGI